MIPIFWKYQTSSIRNNNSGVQLKSPDLFDKRAGTIWTVHTQHTHKIQNILGSGVPKSRLARIYSSLIQVGLISVAVISYELGKGSKKISIKKK